MKKFISVTIILLIEWQILYNQTVNSASHPITEIFTDFHLNLNDTSKTTGLPLTELTWAIISLPKAIFQEQLLSMQVNLMIWRPDRIPESMLISGKLQLPGLMKN
jgi:hypothetical protein